MSKITDYSYVETLASDNVFLIDGSNGTKIITAEDVSKSLSALLPGDDLFALLDEVGEPMLHRQIWRGKNLGTSFTSDQKTRIADGTFKGLWLGDFWQADPANHSPIWRIVDFDYWYNTGEVDNPLRVLTHHIVVMPDVRLYLTSMNDTATVEGGYYGSKMKGGANGVQNSNLANALTMIQGFFGNSLVPHFDQFTNAVTDGMPSGSIEIETIIDIPTEIMMYGTRIRSIGNADAYTTPTYSKQQLAGFQANPRILNSQSVCWLQDVVSSSRFAAITKKGLAGHNTADSTYSGVRPVFAIGDVS